MPAGRRASAGNAASRPPCAGGRRRCPSARAVRVTGPVAGWSCGRGRRGSAGRRPCVHAEPVMCALMHVRIVLPMGERRAHGGGGATAAPSAGPSPGRFPGQAGAWKRRYTTPGSRRHLRRPADGREVPGHTSAGGCPAEREGPRREETHGAPAAAPGRTPGLLVPGRPSRRREPGVVVAESFENARGIGPSVWTSASPGAPGEGSPSP